ncbi:GntR family transcriptional regulator, partial [Klebsiella pneumoniae]|nr:GntR family transcriptional regulator [Klebsiella pneumoniae]
KTQLLRHTSLSYRDSGTFLNYSVLFPNASEYQVDYHLRRVQAQSPLA